MPELRILGIRGIPANHGGFETFAEHLSLYLVNRGWTVTVYCQNDEKDKVSTDVWRGIKRVHIPVKIKGAPGTILFDCLSTWDASKSSSLILTLGYNTAVLGILYRLKGLTNVLNMDGIEWQRDKWKRWERLWLYFNEVTGALIGNHLVADHPEIKSHLQRLVRPSKISFIPYSASKITFANEDVIAAYQLIPGEYALLIARPEPENSILEIVRAFSARKRGRKLVILGDYDNDSSYHKKVVESAGNEVVFLGAVYDKAIVQNLRWFARFYIHGHTVGGTNPSLVEALAANSAVLAHDNRFNRWVAGRAALYFSKQKSCEKQLDILLTDDGLISQLKIQSEKQYNQFFTKDRVYGEYEQLLLRMYTRSG